MPNVWKLRIEQNFGILEFDTPEKEVNVLDSKAMEELRGILKDVSQKKEIRALLVASAKQKIFIAGADIKEIDGIREKKDAFDKAENGKAILQMIEDLKIPTIAVINGACLGGGFELALACDWRVASFSDKVKIGLPEVNLGILPGFGGTQRLPRLLGLVKALPLILAGKIVSSESALKNGMVDRLFSEVTLLGNAVHFAEEVLKGSVKRRKQKAPWFLEKTPVGRALVFHMARKDILKKTKGQYPAPLKTLEVIQKTFGKDSTKGYRFESEVFADLALTAISKNLIKLFYMHERYKKVAWTQFEGKVQRVKKCGVVGAGVMGGGIAQLVSYKNIPVRIKDIQPQALGGALKEAQKIYDQARKRRKLKKHECEYKMGLISVGLSDDGLKRADMIIEAVVEDMGIKEKVFEHLSRITEAPTVLASNTSALSVTRMAEVSRYPERVVGLHFFNPVSRMPLVEIIKTDKTSDETIERTIRFARDLGKIAIVVKDVRGFLVNRLLLPYMNEAAFLMEEGVSQEAIDKAAVQFGMPMGPIELVDHVGIDVGYKVAHILHEAYGERMKPAKVLETAKDKGLLGKKSGKGFYLYKGRKKTPNQDLQKTIGKKLSMSSDEIQKQLIYIMVNEAARCLEERVVEEPSSIDVGMIMGTGFAPFRAGLLHYADDEGIGKVVEGLKKMSESKRAGRLRPCDYLVKMADSGKTFYS
ncbi:MAG: enoyl-CoA hydratase/isomerase family protein [Candidatus Omnitrophica bacterium]|nr:enoyl-CoA hydratase/isomerase family protein [Candidatus Omnitrophota bacterium]